MKNVIEFLYFWGVEGIEKKKQILTSAGLPREKWQKLCN